MHRILELQHGEILEKCYFYVCLSIVSESFDIEMNYAQNMCLPNKQTVLLFGMQYVKGHEDWRLFRYHRSRKRLLNCMEIPECKPDGMAMITMSGNPRLALSYG